MHASQIIVGASEREITSKYYKPSISEIPEKLESSRPKDMLKTSFSTPAAALMASTAASSIQNSEEELYNTMLMRRTSTIKKNPK
ncbi:hypothetical protein PYW07_009562 [Mythimna separata]|uniref:Uncharacterized protein n=1 Tax=Mythimna separata TaxID=271217 RepID=A0AAD8DNA6_MYTSE|nr:hypothetical protein PYW07_009562 [Mythimna separata]